MIKTTSYAYGEGHQQEMLRYYREAKSAPADSWHRVRIELVRELLREAHRIQGRPANETTVVDVGCSIGTCALIAAEMGFQCHGVDFDEAAIRIARELSREEGVRADFHVLDISDWPREFPRVDIAIASDIFEHLHDDELGALLVGLRKTMSSDGLLAFHTAPQEYDYLFWRKKGEVGMIDLPLPFWFFKWLPDEPFTRLTRMTALLIDVVLVAFRGRTYKEHIKKSGHPNPLTRTRMTDILERSGYEVLSMRSLTAEEQMKPRHAAFFRTHSVTHRSLLGIAKPVR